LCWSRAIELQLLLFQLLKKLDAEIYSIRLEIEEIQAAAFVGRVWFSREVDDFGEGSSDLLQKR